MPREQSSVLAKHMLEARTEADKIATSDPNRGVCIKSSDPRSIVSILTRRAGLKRMAQRWRLALSTREPAASYSSLLLLLRNAVRCKVDRLRQLTCRYCHCCYCQRCLPSRCDYHDRARAVEPMTTSDSRLGPACHGPWSCLDERTHARALPARSRGHGMICQSLVRRETRATHRANHLLLQPHLLSRVPRVSARPRRLRVETRPTPSLRTRERSQLLLIAT